MTREAGRKPCRWSFANAVFDERSWTLIVNGSPVAVEGKPLSVLLQLLLHPGEKVTKEHLMETVWPGVFVAEASLTTAMRKLREAIGDDRKDNRIIETVSGIGYRLLVPVACEISDSLPEQRTPMSSPPDERSAIVNDRSPIRRVPAYRLAGIAIIAGLVAGTSVLVASQAPVNPRSAATSDVNDKAILAAVRKLDVSRIEQFNVAGWNPNKTLDADGNAALHKALEVCEWNPAHDRQKLLLTVRFLYDAGAKVYQRNKWGDTPYSIAKAKRYCGPDHPVTRMMHHECFSGNKPLGDRCIASYELKRSNRANPRASSDPA